MHVKKDKILKIAATLPEKQPHNIIAKQVGCTREYVRLVLGNNNLPKGKHGTPLPRCQKCNTLLKQHTTKLCKSCQCSKWGAAMIELSCAWCGKRLWRNKNRRANKESKIAWCNRTHQGKWIGAYHGFGTNRCNAIWFKQASDVDKKLSIE